MITITTPLTRFVWWGPDLPLSEPLPWKSFVTVLRVLNAAGTGHLSYSPASAFNSYLTIRTGDVLELFVRTVPSGGFDIDNGTPPTLAPKPAPAEVELILTEADPLVCDMQQFTELARFTLSRASEQDQSLVVLVSINQSDFLTLEAASAAVASLSDEDVAGGVTVQFRVSRPTTTPTSIFITFSY